MKWVKATDIVTPTRQYRCLDLKQQGPLNAKNPWAQHTRGKNIQRHRGVRRLKLEICLDTLCGEKSSDDNHVPVSAVIKIRVSQITLDGNTTILKLVISHIKPLRSSRNLPYTNS